MTAAAALSPTAPPLPLNRDRVFPATGARCHDPNIR